MKWGGILELIKDYLFPIFCVDCGMEGRWWCQMCLNKNFTGGIFCCPVCHQSNSNGCVCEKCKATSFLNGSVAFFNYNEDCPIGILIKKFKFNLAVDITKVWKEMVQNHGDCVFVGAGWRDDKVLIIPVPLHKKRFNERGFNQSEIIARLVFENLDNRQAIFDKTNLIRQKNTAQQARLNKKQRFENIKDAFVWRGNNLDGYNIILVDDVYTTGATMQACAQVLKQYGANNVYGLTLARG